MSALKKNVIVGALSLTLASTILTSPSHAVGKGDPRFKNNLGLYTVECQVHLNEPGNPVVGYVVGNHGKDPAEAEKKLMISFHASMIQKNSKNVLPKGIAIQ